MREPAKDMPLAELMADWLALDCDPSVEGGLSTATFESFKGTANKHIIGNVLYDRDDPAKVTRARMSYAIGHLPAASFSDKGPIPHMAGRDRPVRTFLRRCRRARGTCSPRRWTGRPSTMSTR